MTQPQKYFLGPGLVDKLRDTVRRVDALSLGGRADSIPTVIESIPRPAAAGGFKIATFTGSWATTETKTVTFKNVTTTPNTVLCENVLFPLPSLSTTTNSPTVCAIGKEGTAWYVIGVIHAAHDVLTKVSLTPTALEFERRSGMSISVTASTAAISASSCENKASGAQLSTFLG